MSFPETFGGDPIVINEHCSIFFLPQLSGSLVVVACSTSPRRMKVRVDLSQSTRYCRFSPMVGAVVVGPMIVEATITPQRVRNIGLVRPEKGSASPSHVVLLSQLIYTAHVFLEGDKGVMVPSNKWDKQAGPTLLASTLRTLSPTTLASAWPSWMCRLRPLDFVVVKRHAVLSSQRVDGKREKKVLLHVDMVAGGRAYLVSVVNKTRIPHRVVYRPRCVNGAAGNSTADRAITSDAKRGTFCENATVSFSYVPMDGRECADIMALEGYVPGGGDAALGWVVVTGGEAPDARKRGVSHDFTATACDPAVPEAMGPQPGAELAAQV